MTGSLRLVLTVNGTAASISGSVRSGDLDLPFRDPLDLLAAIQALLDRDGKHRRKSEDHEPALTIQGNLARADAVWSDPPAAHPHLRTADQMTPVRPPAVPVRAPCHCAPAASCGRTGAVAACEASQTAVGPGDESLERAHALLALGRAHRRAKQWAAAREAFVAAHRIFEHSDAVDWADTASAEIARCGLRVPAGELTASEQRIAELVAQGYSNRAIAATVFVSHKTVEAHLARVYRKLRIRSRAQLAAHIATRGQAARVAGQ